MSILKKVLIVFTILVVLVASLAFDAFYSAPSRFTVRYETLESIYIPEGLSDTSILFFSDLKYGPFMKEQRLQKLVQAINNLSPDVVIFGGDIFADDYKPSEDDKNIVKTTLKEICAPLGKFAVLGDTDQETLDDMGTNKGLLYEADFEVLDNKSISIRNFGSDSITLVGLQNGVNGYADITTAYENISRSSFTIAICHTPDTAKDVPTDLTKYFLAGHSLGGQVYYGLGSLYTPLKADYYFKGKHTVNDSVTLDITSGTGTVIKDVRFLSNAEIVLYRLKRKSIMAN